MLEKWFETIIYFYLSYYINTLIVCLHNRLSNNLITPLTTAFKEVYKITEEKYICWAKNYTLSLTHSTFITLCAGFIYSYLRNLKTRMEKVKETWHHLFERGMEQGPVKREIRKKWQRKEKPCAKDSRGNRFLREICV